MYKKAARLGLTYQHGTQVISFTKLWQLPLESKDPNGVSLDVLATALQHKLSEKTVGTYLNVNKAKAANELDHLRFDIIKDVIDDIQYEQLEKVDQAARESLAQRAKKVLAERAERNFENLSDAELEKIANGK